VPVEPGDAGAMADHRSRPRRRGRALDEAIYRATLDELAEHGYAKLTMEGVADRARAGKASLYRRWPTRVELVLDAVAHTLPDPLTVPDTGSLRGWRDRQGRRCAACSATSCATRSPRPRLAGAARASAAGR
jgi:Bacterial regulatory proteins, tetR family